MNGPTLYPHPELDEVARQDPECVLRWAGTWLSGDAAKHSELLRRAADTVAAREKAVAELIDAATQVHDANGGDEQWNRLAIAILAAKGGAA